MVAREEPSGARTEPNMAAQPHHAALARGASSPAGARIAIDYFAVATAFFAAGVLLAPWVVSSVVRFFYQPIPLALVHIFTLGWITSVIMGVMYRYVPALTHRPLPFPRLVYPQLACYAIGVLGMVSHFAMAAWVGMWSAAIVVVVGVILFAVNLLPCVAAGLGRGVAETGMFLSTCYLLLAAGLGTTLGLNRTFGFLGQYHLGSLAAHAGVAALGWVTLTICAASYRFVPAFILPEIDLPRSAMWQLWTLAACIAGLIVALIAGIDAARWWSAAVVLSLLWYLSIMARLIGSHRLPIDWSVRHAIAGICWLVAAAVLGVWLTWVGMATAEGNRLAGAYGAAGLLGWVGNFIIGMSYHLFPGFVSRVRTAFGWKNVTVAEISISSLRPFVFVAFNLGSAVTCSAMLLGSRSLAQAGAALIATAGLPYAATTFWTLSYAYRRAIPRSATGASLRILQ